jgi:GTPase SAR1 family protein
MFDICPSCPTGEAGTGKSCLLHHFTQNKCTQSHQLASQHDAHRGAVKEQSQHTIGVEFSSRTVKLGEKKVKLQVGSISLDKLRVKGIEFVSSSGIQQDRSGLGGWNSCEMGRVADSRCG